MAYVHSEHGILRTQDGRLISWRGGTMAPRKTRPVTQADWNSAFFNATSGYGSAQQWRLRGWYDDWLAEQERDGYLEYIHVEEDLRAS